ncbi:MAG: zinc ribbon domain-containing protein [Lachnospiraceae bacterium]
MGDFFDDLGKRISETAEVVGKKTEEVVNLQKIKNQIRILERTNEKDIKDLGEMVYADFRNKEEMAVEYVTVCEEIQKREDTIEAFRQEIAQIKGIGTCEKCNQPVEEEMTYCPNCGAKIERVEPPIVDADDAVDESIFEEEDTAEQSVSDESGE